MEKWSVVEFENKTISTVPSFWILNDKNGGLSCYWPRKSCEKHIKQRSKPEDNWDLHPITLLYQTGAFEDALKYENETVEELALTNNTEPKNESNKRKRKMPVNPDYIVDYRPLIISPPPSVAISEQESEESSSVLNDTDIRGDVEEGSVSLNTRNFIVNKEGFLTTSTLGTLIDPITETVEATGEKLQIDSNNQKETLDRILIVLHEVKEMLHEQNKFLVSYVGEKPQSSVKNFDLLPKMPLKKVNKVNNLNEALQLNKDICNQLDAMYFLCGGTNHNEAIIRALKKTFTDKLATKYSWTGRRNNYPLKTLKIMELMKVSIRKRFTSLSDKDFEMRVASWFRQAPLRHLRSKN